MARSLIKKLISKLNSYNVVEIEASIASYISNETHLAFAYSDGLDLYKGRSRQEILTVLQENDFPLDVEFIIDFFEALLDKNNVNKNGIVFTPKYIAEYMYSLAAKKFDHPVSVLDPSCGCGMFLVVAAQHLRHDYSLSFSVIYENYIYGIELDPDNSRRCKLVLHLLPLLEGENDVAMSTHILCHDSLTCDWTDRFATNGFDIIIGNPPYVNPHDMDPSTSSYLRDHFQTTQNGTFNIFYAFIEKAYQYLTDAGVLNYIVPNNFLSIRAACDLRKFISDHKCLSLILDLAGNMVFKPVRTYSCIIQLTCKENHDFEYCVLPVCQDVADILQHIEFQTLSEDSLTSDVWKLLDPLTSANITKIESQVHALKPWIHVGIATLCDSVYMVDKDFDGFYKIIDHVRYDLETDLIHSLYKVPDLRACADLSDACRYIIFPYKQTADGYTVISEDEMQSEFPLTYAYLFTEKDRLSKRDKGRGDLSVWYAYGRTQGLGYHGRKLLFPTFSDMPRFTLISDIDAFFCNGYAVLEPDFMDLSLLQRILNSDIMQYYIIHTSYVIEGSYHCYQKKYIERFSIPEFSNQEKEQMLHMSDDALNSFLAQKYDFKGDFS